MVIAAATGYGGRQRDVARVYFENGAPKVARGGFYAWFGSQPEATMAGRTPHSKCTRDCR